MSREPTITNIFGTMTTSSGIKIGFASGAKSERLMPYTTYRVATDGDCHIRFTTTSGDLATTDDPYMPAGAYECFTTGKDNRDWWISVITDSPVVSGNLYCHPMTPGFSYVDWGTR